MRWMEGRRERRVLRLQVSDHAAESTFNAEANKEHHDHGYGEH